LTTFFVDTSALGRRYITEIGSTWVRSWIEPIAGNIIVISDLTPVEMFSVLARRQREKSISATDVAVAQKNILLHVEKEYLSVGLDADVLVQARVLVSKYTLRTLDAIQLACAIKASVSLGESMVFVCADNNLLSASASEGFATDNPYLHP
jgi:predicted nucleic acid-binding protein